MEKKQKLENNWRQKSISNLEKRDFGDPRDAPTAMIRRCLELSRIPLDEFTVDDIRLMIGQNFSLQYLVPLAVEHLREDIFVEGNYYPGDLLASVLKVEAEFWRNNISVWKEIAELISERRGELADRGIDTTLFYSLPEDLVK